MFSKLLKVKEKPSFTVKDLENLMLIKKKIEEFEEPRKVAKFEKVSFEKWKEYISENVDKNSELNDDENLKKMIEEIVLPKRSTEHSAGYDFRMPFDVMVNPGCSVTIPTGIRVKIKSNWVLKIYPRSGLGFKFNARFANTVGIIDADYYNATNEGHIMINISNNSNGNIMKLKKGDKFCQGIFVEYGITENDNEDVHEKRTGGLGSTGR